MLASAPFVAAQTFLCLADAMLSTIDLEDIHRELFAPLTNLQIGSLGRVRLEKLQMGDCVETSHEALAIFAGGSVLSKQLPTYAQKSLLLDKATSQIFLIVRDPNTGALIRKKLHVVFIQMTLSYEYTLPGEQNVFKQSGVRRFHESTIMPALLMGAQMVLRTVSAIARFSSLKLKSFVFFGQRVERYAELRREDQVHVLSYVIDTCGESARNEIVIPDGTFVECMQAKLHRIAAAAHFCRDRIGATIVCEDTVLRQAVHPVTELSDDLFYPPAFGTMRGNRLEQSWTAFCDLIGGSFKARYGRAMSVVLPKVVQQKQALNTFVYQARMIEFDVLAVHMWCKALSHSLLSWIDNPRFDLSWWSHVSMIGNTIYDMYIHGTHAKSEIVVVATIGIPDLSHSLLVLPTHCFDKPKHCSGAAKGMLCRMGAPLVDFEMPIDTNTFGEKARNASFIRCPLQDVIQACIASLAESYADIYIEPELIKLATVGIENMILDAAVVYWPEIKTRVPHQAHGAQARVVTAIDTDVLAKHNIWVPALPYCNMIAEALKQPRFVEYWGDRPLIRPSD